MFIYSCFIEFMHFAPKMQIVNTIYCFNLFDPNQYFGSKLYEAVLRSSFQTAHFRETKR